MKVNCVCTHDAVRVLHRSTAMPIVDPVAEQVERRSALRDALAVTRLERFLAGARSSSRSANRMAMS